MKLFRLFFFSLFLFLSQFLYSQAVSNIRFEQIGKQIHIYYDLEGEKGDESYTIQAFCSTDNGITWGEPLQKVAGAVGEGQQPGISKEIIWDVLAEKDKLSGDILFKVIAKPYKKKQDYNSLFNPYKTWWGLKAGITFNQFRTSGMIYNYLDNPPGFTIGVVLRILSQRNTFAFQMEGNFERINFQNKDSINNNLVFNCYSLPLIFLANIGKRHVKSYLDVGIPISIVSINDDYFSEYTALEVMLQFGGGIHFYFSETSCLTIDVNYYLNNLLPDFFTTYYGSEVKRRAVSLSLILSVGG